MMLMPAQLKGLVQSLCGSKRQGHSQSKSLGNSSLLDSLECLQTGCWWAWRHSMHCVTHELCDSGDVVCLSPSSDCHNMGDSRSHQKQCGIFLCWSFLSFTQKMETLNMLKYWCFANLISTLSFHYWILSKSTQLFQMFWFFVSRTHSNRVWSCQNVPKKILYWAWSLLHSCEGEAGRRNLLQICNFLATARMQILLLQTPLSDTALWMTLWKSLSAFNSKKSMIHSWGIQSLPRNGRWCMFILAGSSQ